MISKNAPDYGNGVISIELSTADLMLLDQEELAHTFLERLGAPDYQPPRLPEVALKLTQLLNKPGCETSEIVKLLESDPMLVAQVLKIAQSPLYSGSNSCLSLKDVIVRLGRSTLSDIVLQAALNSKIFRVQHYQGVMTELNMHSMMTGHLAKAICRYTSFYEEYGFMCGLLHDIGTACIILILADVPRKSTPPSLDSLWSAINSIHGSASGMICKQWGLPADIVMVVEHHHTLTVGGHIHPLAAVICVAEHLAHEYGFGINSSFEEFDRTQESRVEQAKHVLGMDQTKWSLIEREAKALAEKFS